MTRWLLKVVVIAILTTISLINVEAWTQKPPTLPNGGRFAGGSSSAFLLRSNGRTNRDGEEFSSIQESNILFHIYDNILDEPWSSVSIIDRQDELDIISSSSLSNTMYDSWDHSNVCNGDECEVCFILIDWKMQYMNFSSHIHDSL